MGPMSTIQSTTVGVRPDRTHRQVHTTTSPPPQRARPRTETKPAVATGEKRRLTYFARRENLRGSKPSTSRELPKRRTSTKTKPNHTRNPAETKIRKPSMHPHPHDNTRKTLPGFKKAGHPAPEMHRTPMCQTKKECTTTTLRTTTPTQRKNLNERHHGRRSHTERSPQTYAQGSDRANPARTTDKGKMQ